MDRKEIQAEDSGALRQRAVQRLATGKPEPDDLTSKSPDTLVEELRIHQIELETQNEELRRVQAELETSRDRYFSLYDLAPVGYLLLEGGLVTECNLMAAEMVGTTRRVFLQQRFSRYVLPVSEDTLYLHIREVQKTQLQQTCELQLKTHGDRALHVHLASVSVFDADRQISGFRMALTDITQRKEVEAKLLAYQRKLKSLASELTLAEERMKQQVASDLHDQVSQLLAMTIVRIASLGKQTDTPSLERELREIEADLLKALEETRSLTTRISYPVLTVLGFKKAVREWLKEEIEDKHDIATFLRVDEQELPLSDDLRAVLFRGVRELLTNAAKHAQATQIRVSIDRQDNDVKVSVSDNGCGDTEGRCDDHPTGYGLLSIREALEYFNGQLLIESQPDRGLRATITVPLQF